MILVGIVLVVALVLLGYVSGLFLGYHFGYFDGAKLDEGWKTLND